MYIDPVGEHVFDGGFSLDDKNKLRLIGCSR